MTFDADKTCSVPVQLLFNNRASLKIFFFERNLFQYVHVDEIALFQDRLQEAHLYVRDSGLGMSSVNCQGIFSR